MRKTLGGAAIEVLREHLSALPTGDISAVGPVTALLAACWNEFAGSGSERMHAGKLARMEDVRWNPPGAQLHDRAAWGDGHGLDPCGAATLACRFGS